MPVTLPLLVKVPPLMSMTARPLCRLIWPPKVMEVLLTTSLASFCNCSTVLPPRLAMLARPSVLPSTFVMPV